MHRFSLVAFLGGLLAMYFAERTLADTPKLVVLCIGLGGLVSGTVFILTRLLRSEGDRRLVNKRLLFYYSLCALALGLYALQREPWALITTGKMHTALSVLWPSLLLFAALPVLTMEVALWGMRRTPTLESGRVWFASRAARIVALGIIGFAGFNYAGAQWNRTYDLSYFKTTQPGTATKALLNTLTSPVSFVLFFPPGNDVLEQAQAYLAPLAQQSALIEVSVVDHALEPELARNTKVRGNGFLVIQANSRHETIRLGLDVWEARTALRELDSKVHTKLLALLRPPRVAYLTTGHEERDWAPTNDDSRPAIRDFKQVLEVLGFTVKRLGLGQGLGAKIPDDASLIALVGPLAPLPDGLEGRLVDYAKHGGRLLVFADPDHSSEPMPLFERFGIKLDRQLIADDRYLLRLPGKRESPYDIVTAGAAMHPAVTTLAQLGSREALVFGGSGSLETANVPPGLKVTFIVRSMANSWRDTEPNGVFDAAKEARQAWNLVAAVSGQMKFLSPTNHEPDALPAQAANDAPASPEFRGVFVADADIVADGRMYRGNQLFVADVVRWLVEDEDLAGSVETERDVPIVHRKDEDAVWFYGTSFVLPSAVLALGLTLSRRRQRSRRK